MATMLAVDTEKTFLLLLLDVEGDKEGKKCNGGFQPRSWLRVLNRAGLHRAAHSPPISAMQVSEEHSPRILLKQVRLWTAGSYAAVHFIFVSVCRLPTFSTNIIIVKLDCTVAARR